MTAIGRFYGLPLRETRGWCPGGAGMKRMRRVSNSKAYALLAALALGACASAEPDVAMPSRPSVGCVDDSKQCIDQRQAALRTIMADKNRSWVKQPATPEAYASGVRLFAFKGRKKEMTCDELAHGRREADAAPGVLRGPSAAGLSPAQISRSAMLAEEVSKELAIEMKRRCRA